LDWTFSKTPASFQISFGPDDKTRSEFCTFLLEDGSAVVVSLYRQDGTETTGKDDQPTRALGISIGKKGVESGEYFTYSFLPGPIEKFQGAGAYSFVASSGTKAVYATTDLFLRLRIMDSDGKQFSAPPVADQEFEVILPSGTGGQFHLSG